MINSIVIQFIHSFLKDNTLNLQPKDFLKYLVIVGIYVRKAAKYCSMDKLQGYLKGYIENFIHVYH